MALGIRGRNDDNNILAPDPNGSPDSTSKEGYDPESTGEKGRKMSRIADVMAESDQESQLSVGKQLELEANNSIKYRTCSWQKVI